MLQHQIEKYLAYALAKDPQENISDISREIVKMIDDPEYSPPGPSGAVYIGNGTWKSKQAKRKPGLANRFIMDDHKPRANSIDELPDHIKNHYRLEDYGQNMNDDYPDSSLLSYFKATYRTDGGQHLHSIHAALFKPSGKWYQDLTLDLSPYFPEALTIHDQKIAESLGAPVSKYVEPAKIIKKAYPKLAQDWILVVEDGPWGFPILVKGE